MAAPTAVMGTFLLLTQNPSTQPANLEGLPGWIAGAFRNPFVTRGLMPAALIALGPILLWFLVEGAPLLSRAQVVSDRVGLQAGFPEVTPSIGWYALTASAALSNVLAALGLAGLLLCALKRSVSIRTLVVTLVAGYPILGNWVYAWMNFAPLLPVVAVLTAVAIADIRYRWLSHGLAAIFCFSVVTWGIQPWSRPIASALGAPLDRYACHSESRALAFCPDPPRSEPWPVREVLEVILANDDCRRERACRLAVVRSGRMFPALFAFHLVRDWPDSKLQVVRWRDPSQRTSPSRMAVLPNEYVLYFDSNSFDPDSIDPDATSTNPSRTLASLGPGFSEAHRVVASFDFPDGITANLLERINRP